MSTPNPDQLAALDRLPVHLLETTWRVAVPILLFSIGGYKLDQRYGTKPWLSIAGLFLALTFATLLIYRYLKANFPETFKREQP
jgi:NhaP-type Na+/H+ or K+/H+ antiporter